jgi:hypothetical protein
MRLLLIAPLAFALAGCWAGLNLYSASDARPAIPPGLYKATSDGEAERVYRVSILPNGLTQFDTGEKKEIYGFVPLDAAGGSFVGWMNLDEDPAAAGETKEANQVYALVVSQPRGGFIAYAPECRDEAGEIARRSGATVEKGESNVCFFRTRASLEAALRLLPRDEGSALKLDPVR